MANPTELPTVAELGTVHEDVQKMLADLDAQSRADLPEGTLLGETNLEGMPIRRRKQSSLVTYEGRPLPERLKVWRTRPLGQEASVPTALLGKMLSKRHPDGTKVFLTEKPETPVMEIYAETCEICERRDGFRTKFPGVYEYEAHMDILHPREWQSKLRERDRQDRLEEREVLRSLVSERGSNVSTIIPVAGFKCETCGRTAKSAAGLKAHIRGAHGMS